VRGHNVGVDDPYAVLGLDPGASDEDAAAAYRRMAKEWHPDRGGGPERAARMAQINAAYDLLRSAAWQRGPASVAPEHAAASGTGTGHGARSGGGGPRRRGDWLPAAVRGALGRELVGALEDGEEVSIVTPVATWASPRAVLAVTDRRLLWLHDDAVSHRVRSLPLRSIAAIEHRLRRPRRRTATVRLRTANGRRLSFAELRPETAEAIVALVAPAVAARSGG
jgi:hypothetical protein